MQSRRSFLFGSLSWTCGTLFLIDNVFNLSNSESGAALAKKTPRSQPTLQGPHTLSREDWAPAIVPDHVGIVDKGYICFTDEFGRLAVVDMRKQVSPKSPVKVVAELSGLGNKMVDLAVTPFAAYGLTYREGEQSEAVIDLVSVSLTPVETPAILSNFRLGRYSEAGNIAASNELICVSGTTSSGENLVSIYSAPKRGSKEPTYISSLSVQLPVRSIDLTEKQLTILSSAQHGQKSQVDFVNLTNAGTPEISKSLTIEGDYRVLTRNKDLVLVAGVDAGSTSKVCTARLIVAGSNHTPGVLNLDPLTQVESAAAQNGRFLVVGRNRGERLVFSLGVDRSRSLVKEQQITIASGKSDGGKNCSVVMRDNFAYVATGWSGVQLLTRAKEGNWSITSSYSIPKLAAAGVAVWKDLVVLAGSDLQLYNVGRPERPIMMNSAAPPQAVKALVGAGSFVLCLTKDDISLRNMEKLQTIITSSKLQATQICFDNSQKKAFAIKFLDKNTRVQPVKVFSDKLEQLKSFEVPGIFSRCQASNGQLILGGLNDIAVYGSAGLSSTDTTGSDTSAAGNTSNTGNTTNTNNSASSNKPAGATSKTMGADTLASSTGEMVLIGSRHFENLAVRDIAFADQAILVTAIDQNSKGFFLVLARNDKDLHVLGSIDLPHDGLALGCQGKRAVAVGRGQDGKDVATVINFDKPSAPQIISTLPAIEGVSSVAIRDQIAVLGGRGLEILALS